MIKPPSVNDPKFYSTDPDVHGRIEKQARRRCGISAYTFKGEPLLEYKKPKEIKNMIADILATLLSMCNIKLIKG
jgi:hypothetical protein